MARCEADVQFTHPMTDAPEVLPSVDEQPTQADLDHFKNILPKLSPLARAVYDGDQAEVEELVRRGCGFDEVRKNLPSPLTIAITLRRRRMITFLLDSGADPNVHDGALLGFVASRRNLDLLRLLLDRGAKVGSKIRGKTALGWAAELGHLEAVELLLERGAPLEEDEGGGFTPLLIAATRGQGLVVARLLAAGANVNAVTNEHRSPISQAAGKGYVEIVCALANAGAKLESDGDDWTPLTAAAGGGHGETVQELLRRGADPNGPSQKIWTPLVIAAYNGRVESIRLLLSAGADPDRTDGKGRTALMWASWRQFRRCYETLLAAGADPGLRAPEGVLPHAAPPVPPLTRSKGLPKDGLIARVLSRSMVWGGKKRVLLGIPVTIQDIDGQENVAFDVLERALGLLEKHAPSELGRIRRAFSRIIVTEMPLFRAAYADTHRWCIVNWDPKKPALSPSEVGALLSHEATHYRLGRLGFGYRQAERVRVERACSRAAMRLSRHLPGRYAGEAVSREHLHWISPDGLSDARQREAGLAALKKQGVPGWVLKVLEPIVRRIQRKREAS